MNFAEYKTLIIICLICLSYCAFWTIVYAVINYFKSKKEKK